MDDVTSDSLVKAMRERGYDRISITIVDEKGDFFVLFHNSVTTVSGWGTGKTIKDAIELASFNAIESEDSEEE